ncbi:MAG: hypothetical protein EBU82_10280 [Flavobacteriia bacterium]|jgi:hypothetical protein|nr:hypothetical protein [Flavobacteriia bacterium]NBP30167.1 hypothetical protein [Flavobacteriia bacterium]
MKKHLALMNIAKCVIPLNPPSKGEGTDFTIAECVDLFLFPPSEGGGYCCYPPSPWYQAM